MDGDLQIRCVLLANMVFSVVLVWLIHLGWRRGPFWAQGGQCGKAQAGSWQLVREVSFGLVVTDTVQDSASGTSNTKIISSQ